MTKILLILSFALPVYAAEPLKTLEISFDNYYAKIKIKKRKVEFEDPYSNQTVYITKCNRVAWANLLETLSTETKDYELLANTRVRLNSSEDVIVKRNDFSMHVLRTSSLGKWSRGIETHWKDFVSTTESRCR